LNSLVSCAVLCLLLAAFAKGEEERAPASAYLIGPGDVLEVRVFNRPELTAEARVEPSGKIQLPLLDGGVQAACRTETEVREDVTKRYLDYLKSPHVSLSVKQYSSQVVSLAGAVGRPGTFQLERRVRLRELVTLAGGLSPAAGDTIQIARDPERFSCVTVVGPGGKSELMAVSAKGLLSGDEKSNPEVLGGDFVLVTQTRHAWVQGNVYKPSEVPLNEPVTLTRAVAMTGGILPSSRGKIRILRQNATGTPGLNVLLFKMSDIEHNKQEDPLLLPGDIVDVQSSFTKNLAKSIAVAAGAEALYAPLIVLH